MTGVDASSSSRLEACCAPGSARVWDVRAAALGARCLSAIAFVLVALCVSAAQLQWGRNPVAPQRPSFFFSTAQHTMKDTHV